jgi:DNA replication protein DnaC
MSTRPSREVRSIAYQLKIARFQAYKGLTSSDFAASEVNETMVYQLRSGAFIDSAYNIVLIGGSGTSKTHIATVSAIQTIEHHRKKVCFFSTVDLVNQ